MNAKGLDELFGKIEAFASATPMEVGFDEHEVFQGLGHEFMRQREQQRVESAVESGDISQATAQKILAEPDAYRHWFVKG